MKACEYDQYGPPEVIRLREVPVPTPGKRQVRIRVRTAALNPKDMLTRAGKYRVLAGPRFPKRMGYDWSGEVDALGYGVSSIALGACALGMIQAWSAGACAEYVLAHEDQLCLKPDSLTWEQAAALPLSSLTALQALRDEGRLVAGQRVLINGASGGVGVSAVQLAKALGAHVSTLTSEANCAFVRELGADQTFDYRAHDLTRASERYHVIFDAWGNHSFASVRAALMPHGTYVSTVPKLPTIARQLLRWSAAQRARLVVVRSRKRDLLYLMELVERGALRPVLGPLFTLETVADAHRMLATKRTRGKLVVRVA